MNERITFYLILLPILFAFCKGIVELRQRDFEEGTYLLTEPGEYRLMEDIVFNPNPATETNGPYFSSDVIPSQFTVLGGKYDPSAFGIGFFAAIAISTDKAILDLNGFTISQHPEHALQQRFFAVIELADRPFMPSQGPHDFGPSIYCASNVTIKNGIIGLSSHHGIHGNNPESITIENVDFVDYEVAAIAINGGNKIKMLNVRTLGSRRDVPILGTFSAGRFIRSYINHLRNSKYEGVLRVAGVDKTVNDIYEELKASLENVYSDVIAETDSQRGSFIDAEEHPAEHALYHNHHGVVDGNSYGILINQVGVAVNDFPMVSDDCSNGVLLNNVEIRQHSASVNEIVAITSADGVGVVDPVGSVFQIFNKKPGTEEYITISSSNFEEATYIGNAIANAQAFVGKAILAGGFANSRLDTSRSGFTPDIIEWIEADPASENAKLSSYLATHPLICNGDSMLHVDKGVIGLKMDGVQRARLINVKIFNITNFGNLGSTLCDYDTTSISHPASILPGYQGANTRGITISGAVNVRVENSNVQQITSHAGSACGIDVILDSHTVSVVDTFVDKIIASKKHTAEDYTGPNMIPEAVAFRASDLSYEVTFVGCDSDGNIFNGAGGIAKVFLDESIDRDELTELLSSESSFEHSFTTASATSIAYNSLLVTMALLTFFL